MPISYNPTTGEKIQEYDYINDKQINQKLNQAQKTYQDWQNTSFKKRQKLFKNLYEIMQKNKKQLAKLNSLEMGMLYKDALGDVEKSSSNALYFGKNAKKLLAPKQKESKNLKSQIVYEPLGVILSVMPWNYPYNQALRSAIPNIMAGNTVIMKHASNVPQVAQKLQELFQKAGFPKGVYTNLAVGHKKLESIISNPTIKGVNITGSEKGGRNIGQLAGKYLKPSLLELGGTDPFIIDEIDDLDNIIDHAVKGRFANAGQKCNNSKRFIIQEKYYNRFVEKFTKAVKNLKVGDPMKKDTDIGPLAKKSGLETVHKQVQKSIDQGAKLITGGEKLDRKGYFYKPTILADVKPNMTCFKEEIFGPVASIIKAKDIDDAVRLANMSEYGLGCSLFGKNEKRLIKIAKRIEAGNIYINRVVSSRAFLPYGGIKKSGYGKELGESGIKAFINEKVIAIQ